MGNTKAFLRGIAVCLIAMAALWGCMHNPTEPEPRLTLNDIGDNSDVAPIATPVAGGTISGMITLAGQEYVTITATEVSHPASFHQVTRIGGGSYAINGLAAGEYSVQAGTSGGVSQVYGSNVEITDGQVVTDINFTF